MEKRKLFLMCALMAGSAFGLAAMPTEAELEREEPAVKRLLASEHAALASGKMTRTEVAAAAMDLAEKADTEAAKLLLMKGAFVLYVRDGNLGKAVETMNALESAIADMPPEYVENMVELSLLGVSKKEDGARLRQLLGESKNEVKWTYEVVDGAIVLGGNGRTAVPKTTAGALVIPPVIDGKPVRGIGNDAFKRCDGLTSVTIPANVRTVGNGAFSGCCRLTSVTFPAELARIGGYAFWDCKELKEVSISSKWIGDHAFGACSKLASVLLSINVEGIGSGAFAYCGELKQINVEPGNRVFVSVDGVLYTKDRKELVVCPGGLASVTIPSYVSTVRDSAFIGCERLKQIDVDPDNGGYSSIDGMLFTKNKETLVAFPCGRTSAEIPWGTTTIGNNAFSRNSLLTSVTIPSSVTNFIGFHAFSSCHKLKEMTIPARIGWGAFDCAGLESVTILSSAQSIGDCAFLHCGNLKTVTIEEGVSSIGGAAFAGCGSVKTVTIPASVTNIAAYAFGGCGALTSVTMCGERPESGAAKDVFNDCRNLKSIHVPANAKSWSGMKEWQGIPLVFDARLQVAKDRTTVQSIIDGMIKVPGRDYWLSETELTQGQWEAVMGYNLSAHKGANLPVENVSHDDCGVFLERLNQTKEVQSSQFVFSIPTYDEWGYAAQAGGSGNECWIKPGVVGNILEMAWVKENCSNQTHAVATKAPNAFGFYDMLGNVWEWMSGRDGSGHVRIRGRGITDSADIGWGWFIGRYVWFGNSKVRRENIGLRLAARIRPENSVSTVRPRLGSRLLSRRNEPKAAGQQQETVDGYTWSYQEKDGDATICSVLPKPTGNVSIPATLNGLPVTGIGDKVFEGCRAMNSVAIPSTVKTIGEKAFADCGRLTSLSIPRCVTSIGSWAFANCGGFKSVSLPEGLTEIKRGAFYGTEITSVCIPPNVTSIEPAFVRCYGLKTVTIPASVTNIAECAFGVCTSLESINVDSGNPCYRSLNGMVCSKDGLNLVAGVNGEVTIPYGVTNIGPGTFGSLGGLKSLTIPASVTNISERAFQYVHYGCGNLTSVTMLGERPNAPDNVFRGCGKLKAIHVPANAKSWAGMKEWQGIPLVFDVKMNAADELEAGGVQLWENGPFWSECNVGATKPEESGYYFQWGNTIGYKLGGESWVSSNGTPLSRPFDKPLCTAYDKSELELISLGRIDSTGNLVAACDAAAVHLGAPWRMPTEAEVAALVKNCDTEWTVCNGVSGRLVKGRGDFASKSIFLPAAGCGISDRLSSLNSYGCYWHSSSKSDTSVGVKFLNFNSETFGEHYSCGRFRGQSIRPVRGPSKSVSTDDQIVDADCKRSSAMPLPAVIAGPYGIRMEVAPGCEKGAEYVLGRLRDDYLPHAVRYYGDPFEGKVVSRVYKIKVWRNVGKGKSDYVGPSNRPGPDNKWGWIGGWNIGLAKESDKYEMSLDFLTASVLTVCEDANWASFVSYVNKFVEGDMTGQDPVPRLEKDIQSGLAKDEEGRKKWPYMHTPMWAALEELRKNHPEFIQGYCKLKNVRFSEKRLPEKLSLDQMANLLGEVTGENVAEIFKKHGVKER